MLRVDICNFVLIRKFVKLVSIREKQNQQKKQPSQLKETVNYFTIGNGVDVNAMENENLEQQTSGPHNNFERIHNNCSENQVMETNTDDRIRNTVDNAVIAFENGMHDSILTATNDVVIPRVKITVRSIASSSTN